MGKINVAVIGVGNCASCFMKTPLTRYSDSEARDKTGQFIIKNAPAPKAVKKRGEK